MINKEIKEVVKRSLPVNLPNIGQMPEEINDVFLNSKKNHLSIHSQRIILIILSTLKQRQKRGDQLDLFNKDWFDTSKETNYTVQFNFLLKDFLPEGASNFTVARKGLEELLYYKGKHHFYDLNGYKIEIQGGIINSLIINNGQQGVKFNMDAFWYQKFIDITSYNKFIKNIIFSINNVNSLLFYFFLKTIPSNKIKMKLDTINDKFDTNYKYWGKIKEKLFDPIRSDLNANADLSFNYKIENNIAYITLYDTKNSIPDLYNDEEIKIKRAITYKVKQYKLKPIATAQLKHIYNKYGYAYVSKATTRKKELTDKNLQDIEYVKKLHELTIKYLEKNGLMDSLEIRTPKLVNKI